MAFTSLFKKFFKDLSSNNTTAWFNENRKVYEKEVKAPFAAFTENMIQRINKHEPAINIKAGEAIMRINKDVRFSKEKTPYNTYVAANISEFGKKDKSYPGFYFQLSHDKLVIFGGAYMMEPATLQKVRQYIMKDPKGFAAAYNDKDFKKKYGSIKGEVSKRIPEEFQKFSAQEPLIANKQFYYSTELKPDIIYKDDLPDVMMEYYVAGKKLNEFLRKAMK